MTVMRRGETWSFVVWVRDREGVRRQVWRGGYRSKRDAVAAERRFLVEAEDHASEPECAERADRAGVPRGLVGAVGADTAADDVVLVRALRARLRAAASR